jgi:hypothetical protein
MSVTVKLYTVLSAVAERIDIWRTSLLARIWGIAVEAKSLVGWRKREGLPPSELWPRDARGGFVQLKGKVKAGPVRPVPAKFDKDVV